MTRRHRKGGRTTPKGGRPVGSPARRGRDVPPLVAQAQEAIRESSPFSLLAMASGYIEVTTERPADRFTRADRDRVPAVELFESFTQSGFGAMSCLALAVATMHPDPMIVRRIRRDPGALPHDGGPPWLATMGDITITSTHEQRHVLADGENVVIEWRWPDGSAGTAVVYVDHNLGTVVKDAFAIPASVDEIVAVQNAEGESGIEHEPIDPADARARIEQALDAADAVLPPFQSDSWPTSRPMIEWLVRHLPAGGTGFQRAEWTEFECDALVDEFVASPFGKTKGLSADDVIELVDHLVMFACDVGPGDPLRWSPVSVEMVLHWFVEEVRHIEKRTMRRLPDVLASFVRFAHERRGVKASLTRDTLDAIDEWRNEYLADLDKPRLPEERVLTALGGIDLDELYVPFDHDDDDAPHSLDDLSDDEWMAVMVRDVEQRLLDLAGGPNQLALLDDAPLLDLPFDWSVVPRQLLPRAQETVRLMDEWAVELFDAEVRTIARVVLGAVIEVDERILTRSERLDSVAAAVLWVVGDDVVQPIPRERRQALGWAVSKQKELAERTGVPSSMISTRAKVVRNSLGRSFVDPTVVLHSAQRREMLATRQLIADWRAQHGQP